jgi:pimeloyl-ACP methyl ester carboxylesterase
VADSKIGAIDATEAIEKFEIDIAQDVLDDLKERLSRTRLPEQIPGTGWGYGAELGYMRELLEYWRDDFDWREQEAALNRFEHFKTTIDGQRIHFIHARSPHPDAHPLLISHGWPGSIVEFMNVIGPLTDPVAHGGRAEDAFHVVVPSLPGYGFSDPTTDTGWDIERTAQAWKVLMARLGYERYGAQGGDWGAIITTNLGAADAEHLSGIHLNMAMALPPPEGEEGLSDADKAVLAQTAEYDNTGNGYFRIQATKPQTLGFGLNDSPAGLAAWITEKFHGWMDCNGDIESVISKDQLLTNITLYWVTQTITSSTRLYYETTKVPRLAILFGRIEVPVGVLSMPKEILRYPRSWVERHYNVTHWSEYEKGGHFAAMEQPEAFVADVRKFFASVR